MAMEDGGILQPYGLSYSDLISLSSDHPPSSPLALESVKECLGPTGAGLLAISGVPGVSALRKRLLPLARHLALLPNHLRNRILKEHCIGSDVPLKNPDRLVSSFATQLKYAHGSCWELPLSNSNSISESSDDKLEDLGALFEELGLCMVHLGLRLARVCDAALGGAHHLEDSLVESSAAKARLIHYHSVALDAQGRCRRTKPKPKPVDDLWQQWHYDYGVFTVLTSPIFISGATRYEHGGAAHSCLQILDPNTNKVRAIRAPPESFIVQVGESADILSKGRLRSALHSVCRSAEAEEGLSRETFVVFLQPASTKVFDLTDYPMERRTRTSSKEYQGEEEEEEQKQQNEGIHTVIPRLGSRLKSGITFAEFSLQTTKQYYGGRGLQPNR